MKKISILLFFITFVSLLYSCDSKPTTQFQETNDDSTLYINTEIIENHPADNFYTISYATSEAISNFNWDETIAVDKFTFELTIPKHIVNTSGEINSSTYLVFREESQSFVRGFEFRPLIKAEKNFTLQEDIYDKLYPWEEDYSLSNGAKISKGFLESGLEYIMFEKRYDNNDFRTNIFIRISEEYIINIDYSDTDEHYDKLFEIWNSITVKKQEN